MTSDSSSFGNDGSNHAYHLFNSDHTSECHFKYFVLLANLVHLATLWCWTYCYSHFNRGTNSGHPGCMWLRQQPHLVLWTLSQCSLPLWASRVDGRHLLFLEMWFHCPGVFLGAQGMWIPNEAVLKSACLLEWGRILSWMETCNWAPSQLHHPQTRWEPSLWLGTCPG